MVAPVPKVLVVEDEVDLRELLVHHLRREGFEVLATGDGYEANRIVGREQPDVVLLDLMIEGLGGLELCRLWKSPDGAPQTRIIVVSALTSEAEVSQGLETGADDYVRKPFNPKEVVARVKTVYRRAPLRSRPRLPQEVLNFPPLCLDDAAHLVTLAGTPLSLTATEYRLLRFLMRHPERVFSRGQLLAQLGDGRNNLSGRNIDVHIRSLRLKLRDHATSIATARGVGYRFRPPLEGTTNGV